MSEFERKGHWRSLPDGTRTWVSGHGVSRDKNADKPYAGIDLERLSQRTPASGSHEKMSLKERKALEKERMEAVKKIIRRAPRKRKIPDSMR